MAGDRELDKGLDLNGYLGVNQAPLIPRIFMADVSFHHPTSLKT
jgi:hypothetical protein